MLANSEGIAELAREHGARETRVVHLGTDLPARRRARTTGARRGDAPALVTVAHLVGRKRHADVLRTLAVLSNRHPTLRYVIIGDGPERNALQGLALRLGVAERVDFLGALEPDEALRQARRCTLLVMPSTEEAFGVAYVEAMAAGIPAIGCRGEPGPEEIAAAGDGFVLVPPGDIERLSQRVDELLSDPQRLREAGRRARETVARALHLGALRRADGGGLRACAAMKPVLFVTGHAPPDRVGAFARLHELEDVELALFGGRSKHAAPPSSDALPPPTDALRFPHRHVAQRELLALSASGRYRAVVCGTGGRVALPSSWAGARRARVPLILWASLWAHPRSAAHALSYPLLRRLYGSADAVVTYGEHVSAYVRARGARNVHVALQAVDNEFWSAADAAVPLEPAWPRAAAVRFLFVGRPAREKGLGVLAEAWKRSGLAAPSAALVLVGVGSNPPWTPAGGAVLPDSVLALDPVPAPILRNFYANSDVLVLPSIPTHTFREPWGLVCNEAMNQGLPVIVSDAVGAAAGGLVRDRHNGLVVPAGDGAALSSALVALAADPELRKRLGAAGARDVRSYTYDAWARGFSAALDSVGASRAAGGAADDGGVVAAEGDDVARTRW